MPRTEARDFTTRVDDVIFIVVGQLMNTRRLPIRGAMADFRATCVRELEDSRALGFKDYEDIWALRLRRIDYFLEEPRDGRLYERLELAREREPDW
jgi:hypothetical protein